MRKRKPGPTPAPAPEPTKAPQTKKGRKKVWEAEPVPVATEAPNAGPQTPFNIPPEVFAKMGEGLQVFAKDPMLTEVMPWGLAGFAIGALSGLVVYAKKYSITRAIEELDLYVIELERDAKDKKVAQTVRTQIATHLMRLADLRERLVALEPKKNEVEGCCGEPVKVEVTHTPAPKNEPAPKKQAKRKRKRRYGPHVHGRA